MTERGKKRGWKYRLAVAAILALLLPAAVIVALLFTLSSGVVDGRISSEITQQIAKRLNTTAELGHFHFDPWRLRVMLTDLTIHGREPEGTPPFLHISRLEVGIRVDSFWTRKFSVGDVELVRPEIHVRVEPGGKSNLPLPRTTTPGKPIRERLFEVVVRRLRLDDGELLFNDVRVPLVAEGRRLDLAVDYSDADGRRTYLGQFRWDGMELAARRYLPFASDIAVRFALAPDSLSVTQLTWTAPHTSLDAQFSLASFVHPSWTFRYRGRLDFQDIRALLRKPTTPDGRVEFNGDGHFADGKLAVAGAYSAEQIAMHFQWFHTGGIATRGTYRSDANTFISPDFSAQALGGTINGTVQLELHSLQFHVNAHAHRMDLATILGAVNNANFPISPLHWAGNVDVQSVNTWMADFKKIDSSGVSVWTPPAAVRPGEIPVNSRFNYHYSMAANNVALQSGVLTTPTSRLQFNGGLDSLHSNLQAIFDSQDLTAWDDFINHLRGADVPPEIISGQAHWQGRMSGPLAGPAFVGHVKGTNARYGRLYWDEVEGDMTYSPDAFTMAHSEARLGRSSAQFDAALELENWSFAPESPWSFDATLVRTDSDGLQALLGVSYPVHGVISGDFHGKGTRASPEMNGLFDIIDPEAWAWKLDRARGQIHLGHGEVRISNAELRLLPPPAPSGSQASQPAGVVTGNFLYRTEEQSIAFDLTGALLPLAGIGRIQTPRLPVGGQLTFHLAGDGPVLAPKLQGTLRLVNLRLGAEVVGSFNGNIDSDGSRLALQVDSAMSTGSLHANLGVELGGAYPLTSQIAVTHLDLDPLISGVLHLTALTGHSQVDGEFTVAGSLLRPESLALQANLSRILFDYEYVKLENAGPVRFQYAHSEIRVEQANLRGTDTDFRVAGVARFSGDRALDMRVDGNVNLQLFGAFVPNLDARGPGLLNAAFAGTVSNPRITGRVHVEGGSVRYGDFPAGLTAIKGDFTFDTSRVVFDNVSGGIGGGQILLAGALTYGGGPAHFEISATTDQARIRYPMGMSWLAGGNLRLTGTPATGTLSGHVTVDRLLMAEGLDFSSVFGSEGGTAAGSTTSPFLRNLELDIVADSTPTAQLQWPSGTIQTDASLRVRGTWEHPILLGSIHLLNGDMTFRGQRYHLSRGDINFVNPFQIDPVVNIEATTNIRQYEVTVNFSGAASHLSLSYRSDPPLPSSDIIALLALGETGEESQLRGASGNQSTTMGATTLLSEAVSSQLGGRIQRLFGISHFSVDPSYVSNTAIQNPGARVTISQQFSRDFIITYSTDVTSTQQEIIQIEYTLRRNISVIALRDENGTFGMDIVRKKRFK